MIGIHFPETATGRAGLYPAKSGTPLAITSENRPVKGIGGYDLLRVGKRTGLPHIFPTFAEIFGHLWISSSAMSG